MVDALQFIPAAINLLGWGIYIGMMQKKIIKPNPFPWVMSFIMLSVSGLSLLANHAASISIMYFMGAIPALIVLAMSFRYFTKPSLREYLILVFAIMLIALSTISPVLSIIGASTYYLLTYSVFVSKIWSGESVENPIPWGVWSLAGVSQLVLACHEHGAHDMYNIIIPLVLLTLWMATFISVIAKNNINPNYEVIK